MSASEIFLDLGAWSSGGRALLCRESNVVYALESRRTAAHSKVLALHAALLPLLRTRQVSYQRFLRIFILADVFAMVGGVIAAVIFEGTLPEPLRTYAATEELPPLLLIAGVILLVPLIVAWIGLWRSAS
jgi:hypothetical protein